MITRTKSKKIEQRKNMETIRRIKRHSCSKSSSPPPPQVNFFICDELEVIVVISACLHFFKGTKNYKAAVYISNNYNLGTHQYSVNYSPNISHDKPNSRGTSRYKPPINII